MEIWRLQTRVVRSVITKERLDTCTASRRLQPNLVVSIVLPVLNAQKRAALWQQKAATSLCHPRHETLCRVQRRLYGARSQLHLNDLCLDPSPTCAYRASTRCRQRVSPRIARACLSIQRPHRLGNDLRLIVKLRRVPARQEFRSWLRDFKNISESRLFSNKTLVNERFCRTKSPIVQRFFYD